MDGMVHGCVFFHGPVKKQTNYIYEIVKKRLLAIRSTIQAFGFVSKLRAAESGAPFGVQNTPTLRSKRSKREELAQHKAGQRM